MKHLPFTVYRLSNFTINLLPYVIFLAMIIHQSHSVLNALPFALYYTARRTGLFFLHGLEPRSELLVLLGLGSGMIGSFLGLFGLFDHLFWDLAALFIGLGAAWLPAATRTVTQRWQAAGAKEVAHGALLRLAISLILVLTLALTANHSIESSFLILFLIVDLLFCNYLYLSQPADFKFILHRPKPIWWLKFGLILALFLSLLFTRLGRNTGNGQDILISESLFLLAFILLAFYLWQHNTTFTRQLAWPLQAKNLLYGAFISYFWVFSALYLGILKSARSYGYIIAIYLFANILSHLVMNTLHKKIPMKPEYLSLLGILFGLLLTLIPAIFYLGLFILDIFIIAYGRTVNQEIQALETVPLDTKNIIYFRLSSIGNLLIQLILILCLNIVSLSHHTGVTALLRAYAWQKPNANYQQILQTTQLILVLLLFVATFSIALLSVQKPTRAK